jgi:imidazolonepropionase-like amidohydrolase
MRGWRRLVMLMGLAVLGAIGAFALGVVWPEPSLVPPPQQRRLVVRGVTIVDVERGALVPGRTVVIEHGRIVAVHATVPGDDQGGSQVIDGHGYFAMPALWDMHTHVYAFADLLDLPLHVAFGVTHVRDMMGCPGEHDPFIACADQKRAWTREALAGVRVAPRIVSSASFMAHGPATRRRIRNAAWYLDASTPEAARAFVRAFAPTVDEIKVYDGLPADAYRALVDEARRVGRPVVGHRPHAVDGFEAVRHQKSIEHARLLLHETFDGADALRAAAGTPAWHEDRRAMVDRHDPAKARALLEAMREAGTWYVPTHLTRWVDANAEHDDVRRHPTLRYMHPLLRMQWFEDLDALVAADPTPAGRRAHRDFHAKGLELTGQAHRLGVKVLAGTDTLVGGAALHLELEQLVAAGLSTAEVLRAATLHGAAYYGRDHEAGRIAVGHEGDLVLLRADPLQDIRHTTAIAAVVFDGRVFDDTALEAIRAHVAGQARSLTVACKVLWRFVRHPQAH